MFKELITKKNATMDMIDWSQHTKYYFLWSWWYMLPAISTYLAFVFTVGPRLMKNRPAFKVKTFLIIYNITQIILCAYVMERMRIFAQGDLFDFANCRVHDDMSEKSLEYYYISTYVSMLKNLELFDTVLFVLRKKQNQVTPLHVFHHTSVLVLILLYFRYYPAEGTFFPIYMNCFIHVLMYTYYTMAAVLDPQFMRRFIFFKKSLTIMQMIQFVLILIWLGFQGIVCNVPKIHIYYFSFITVAFLYWFYDFYQKSYTVHAKQ
uniref:Elongation of very long chain fatty acids protein n=1 Tax=Glossina morsitans morsitans TaxID=37546 RepID=A0A1B0G3F8_GLOMM